MYINILPKFCFDSCELALPRSEQNIQGGELSDSYRKNNIKHGDPFKGMVIEK